ncbi:reverse transcriptase [Plakobranchus ocellatus]|uniref:Reverse transcriptase n=1 Tax=Plakobranchus ocellatus TaxID=259542 RepID=A0AAV3ZRK6_9GAST|nr:reverse transcriptase [Plakobranchus ocellatus]
MCQIDTGGTVNREITLKSAWNLPPHQLRMDVLKLAHDIPLAGHQGMRRTKKRIQNQFYWPGMYREINKNVKSCHICQKCSKKGPATSRAPLQKMPVITTPFHRLAIDLVGPLAKSDRGHSFILTVVDVATRWVEAVAVKETTTEMVAEALLTIYARLGIPKEILSDHGPQFISDLMNQVCRLIGIKHVYSSIFHPSSNGMCERINGVIKGMLRKVADKHPGDWDRLLPSVLFAYRKTPQDGTKCSPFELMYGRTPRGIMSVLKELYTDQELVQEVKTTYQYVINLERRIYDSCQLAAAKSSENADKATIYADRGAELRSLKPDDKVLVLLPQTKNKLLMRWQGPYIVRERISKVDYVVNVKGIDKVYHINILKPYHEREEEGNAFMSLGVALINDDCSSQTETMSLKIPPMVQSEYVKDVNVSNTIPDHIRTHLDTLLTDNADILTDLPDQSDLGGHAIKLKDEQPINIRPYPIPLHGEETVIKEVKKMLDMGVIEPSNSPYSSSIVLVKKPDGTNRFCIDFRRLNGKTIMDKETISNQEDLFAKLSKASIFSKIDLTKGYWQIPMDDSSKQYTAFQTPIGLMQWKFMPFGLSNAPATFARTMRLLLDGIPNVISYFNDILIYTQDWMSHFKTLDAVLSRLAKHGFTTRPTKMYIGFEEIEFLGHVVGKGKLRPEIVKVERILKLSTPKTKKQVKSLLGLLGYYRKFIDTFASICNPLTELLRKGSPEKIEWTQECEDALNKIKHLFSTSTILVLPDLTKQFVVRTDASDSGIGGVLLQQWDDDLLPCAYVSRKLLDREKKYSIIEREILAIVFALSGFAKYLLLTEFVVESDHRPLQYLQKGKAHNSRLMRWSLCLQEFRFSIRAIPGLENCEADVLSRLTAD